jgi:flavodoxin
MNILLIYDSAFGNTEQLARKVGSTLEQYGTVQLVPAADANKIEIKGVDLLLIGGPTQRHGLTQNIHTFLEQLPEGSLHGIAAAAFDTRYQKATWITGSAAETITKMLHRADAQLLVPPKSFFVGDREGPLVEGELEQAAIWAQTLVERFKLNHPA